MIRTSRLKSRGRAIGTATAAEQRYQDAARLLGCIACLVRGCEPCGPVRIHHRTTGDLHGQLTLGHDAIVSLGDWHHQGIPRNGLQAAAMREIHGPSLHHHKRAFVEWLQDTLGERSTDALQRFQDARLPTRLLPPTRKPA